MYVGNTPGSAYQRFQQLLKDKHGEGGINFGGIHAPDTLSKAEEIAMGRKMCEVKSFPTGHY